MWTGHTLDLPGEPSKDTVPPAQPPPERPTGLFPQLMGLFPAVCQILRPQIHLFFLLLEGTCCVPSAHLFTRLLYFLPH